MKYWLVDVETFGIHGKALLGGTEEDLVRYIESMGGFLPYEEVSESNANVLSRYLGFTNVPRL